MADGLALKGAGWAWSTHATVSASLFPAVEVRVFKHAHVSMITYRVDVYRSRPIGASLLTSGLRLISSCHVATGCTVLVYLNISGKGRKPLTCR